MLEQKGRWARPVLLLTTCAALAATVVWETKATAGDSKGDQQGDQQGNQQGNQNQQSDASDDAAALTDDDAGNADPIALSFATVGDSRQDDAAPDPTSVPPTGLAGQDKIWLQNTKAWARIIRTISKQRAKLLVFNGDMIMGYGNDVAPVSAGGSATATIDAVIGSDLVKAYRQYGFWRGMVATLMEEGTYVVPVSGNHETQWKAGGKKSQVVNENAYRKNLGDLILDDDRFDRMFGEKPTNEVLGDTSSYDSLVSDQSQLTYSFDFHGSHFAIVNTDPVGNDSHAPAKWLEHDLSVAKANGNTHFFVFGHKPAFTYYYGTTIPLPASPSGLDAVADLTSRNAMWATIEKYGATYFCGHEHIYNLSQPTAATGGHAWQVIVGSGGSPFEAKPLDDTLTITDRFYAWAKVDVRKSGKVRITGYGFDDQFHATHRLQSIDLSH
jgi:hypothetical protein